MEAIHVAHPFDQVRLCIDVLQRQVAQGHTLRTLLGSVHLLDVS
jgi:hypothetical protein